MKPPQSNAQFSTHVLANLAFQSVVEEFVLRYSLVKKTKKKTFAAFHVHCRSILGSLAQQHDFLPTELKSDGGTILLPATRCLQPLCFCSGRLRLHLSASWFCWVLCIFECRIESIQICIESNAVFGR